ncbi:hypothetical protein I5Q34_16720 [Streptomyces sp. AV19]|uniref:DUF6716 putative glycosyltransferase n=1 Tax=Streptomyces sp. AV19 TaxID=2793068 RepID=UPI0018FF10B2|nr:DUF6716 putative glycosyltransferase [Streptomyces sp. AV19]MBH1935892.1 hypothetical protein [Streptomyces sp. AV19]MDG4534325.1 hypothetical protein [Streptomyces sp. AV19]
MPSAPSSSAPSRTESPPRVAVLADSDTRWKWGALTARRLAPGASPDGYLLRGRATPTPRQLAEVGVDWTRLAEVTGPEFAAAAGAARYDVVLLACVGGAVQALLHGLAHAWRGAPRRPVVVTGYVGVVYEKLADGLLLRHGADVVLANSRHDAERFRAVYEGVGAAAGSVTECALPFLEGAPYGPADPEVRPYTVVFAAQPSVPDRREDRLYLLERAARHARLHPRREVLIKLRSRPGEHTTHVEELPYQRLAGRLPAGLPANCRLVYGNMGEVLDRADLLVTVSSTAALEALHRGVPTAVLTDLGVREQLGNHHFLGSGCLASWDRLDAGHLPKPEPEWLARQGVATEGAFDAARRRVADLLAPPGPPPLAPYYTRETAPGYLPGILARHGFAPDGRPLPGRAAPPAEESRLRRAARGALREAARGAYRHGVQRVAPVIRRMGEL